MMPITDLVATFCAGTFFGAALFISIAQNPAALEAGAGVGGRFFPPMYRRAAPMQVALAVTGTLAGCSSWLLGSTVLWLFGGLLLGSVIPVTLFFIKPVNDRLLDSSRDPDGPDTADLLSKWGARHWLRSVFSGISFVLFLLAYAGT